LMPWRASARPRSWWAISCAARPQAARAACSPRTGPASPGGGWTSACRISLCAACARAFGSSTGACAALPRTTRCSRAWKPALRRPCASRATSAARAAWRACSPAETARATRAASPRRRWTASAARSPGWKRSQAMWNVLNDNPALAILAGAGVLLAALALLLWRFACGVRRSLRALAAQTRRDNAQANQTLSLLTQSLGDAAAQLTRASEAAGEDQEKLRLALESQMEQMRKSVDSRLQTTLEARLGE